MPGPRLPMLATDDTRPIADSDRLDCVIVGYHDLDIGRVEACHAETRHVSGAYRNFRSNTLAYAGRRRHLMDVLNTAIAEGTGRDPRLSVAALPNLAACYLKSYLRRRGFSVEIVNFFTAERDRLAALLARRPRAVAITTTFYVEPDPIIEVVEFIRRFSDETRIVAGGPYVTGLCSSGDRIAEDYVFGRIGADFYVVDSQGEQTLYRLLKALREPDATTRVAELPNLVYPAGSGEFHRTARAPEANDLDANVIDWRYFEPAFYAPTTQMRTARSCAFKCSFCRYPVVAGALTLTSLDRVEAELRQLESAGVENVVFIDDTFNVPLPRFKDLCRMMIRNRFAFSWFSYFRCSNSDDEAFALMKESGCAGVFLGIESADPGVLGHMNKAASPERYRYGIRKLKENEIVTFASLIVGFPGETVDSVSRTRDFVEEAGPTFYRAELYFHDPKTPIQDKAEALRIQGRGYGWRHASMDWREACDHVDDLYRSIENSIVLPLYMFDFWSLPYVRGRGVAMPTLLEFLRRAQQHLVRGLDDRAGDARLASLSDLFAGQRALAG